MSGYSSEYGSRPQITPGPLLSAVMKSRGLDVVIHTARLCQRGYDFDFLGNLMYLMCVYLIERHMTFV